MWVPGAGRTEICQGERDRDPASYRIPRRRLMYIGRDESRSYERFFPERMEASETRENGPDIRNPVTSPRRFVAESPGDTNLTILAS